MTGDPHHPATAGGRHKRALSIALALTAAYMVVEAVVGLLAGSLALLSDAGHMFTDVLGLGMALAAIEFAASRRTASQTYGLYRLEVLAALANALLLLAVAAYVLYEAYQRLRDPPEILGAPVMAAAAVGLAVNIAGALLLRAGAQESLNVRGAFVDLLGDLLGSLGVLAAGAIVLLTGWPYADPIVGAAIGLFIVPRALRLGRDALRILLEIAPPDIDIPTIHRRLTALSGVHTVHDLHVWTLTSGLNTASGHLTLHDGAELQRVLSDATALLEEAGVQHITLQCEPRAFRRRESDQAI